MQICSLLIVMAGVLCVRGVRADTVKLAGKQAFEEVEIVGFKHGKLLFRGLSGQVLHKPIAQVEWFARDRDAELTLAEQLASAGNWLEAIPQYEKARLQATENWLREWTELRLLHALDQGGQFDRATELYIELTLANPGRAGLKPPAAAGEPNCTENQAARGLVLAALKNGPPAAARAALRDFLLELVLYDDVEPLPAEVGLPGAILPDRSRELGGGKAARERPRYGLLPERAVYTDLPKLREHSIVVEAARAELDRIAESGGNAETDTRRARRLLEGAEPFASQGGAEEVRVLKARLAGLSGDTATAVRALTALSATESGVGCEALYYLAEAQGRAGRREDAVRVYDDLSARCPDWDARARAAAGRLRGPP